ncbi:MAG: hypothetical protein IPK19_30130 [Chloroflexi bacterium]|nr:hypothetical protein [Chloroflexota bacterium]
MQPGLSRAIPMSLLGFLVGSLVVIIIRGLQGLTPLWDTGVGMSLAAFTTAGFFVWGMGAFDPSMSVHGEAAESAHARSSDAAKPSRMLMGVTWQLVTLLLIATIVLFALATIPGGPTLITTAVPEASMVQVGMVEMQIGGQTVLVSQLVILLVIIIAMFVSLLAVAGGLAWVLNKLHQGVVEAKSEAASAPAATEAATVEVEPAAQAAPTTVRRLGTLALFAAVFVVLYLLFYYVAIGLIMPQPDLPGLNLIFPSPEMQLVVLSLVNALVITFILLRPSLVLRVLGQIARFIARLLRRVPGALQ